MPRRFQFSLATILWVMVLVPAFFFICGAPPPHRGLGKFALFAGLSYLLKRIIEKLGKHQLQGSAQRAHPMDE